MCEQLKLVNQNGYFEALVSNDTDYCSDFNDAPLKPIRFLYKFNKENLQSIYGLTLHLSSYLSSALNMSMRFVPLETTKKINETTGTNKILNGDVIAMNKYWPPYQMGTNYFHPIGSPIFKTVSGGILSLVRPRPIRAADIVAIFDFKIYWALLLSVLLVSAFLYFSKISTKLCKRTFPRQVFEMLLLIALEPKIPGLIYEKNFAIRLIIAVSILAGLLMRKNFGAKINAIFTFQSFDYVTDLGNSLEANRDIKFVITRGWQCKALIKPHLPSTEYKILENHKTDIEAIESLLNHDSIYIFTFDTLEELVALYPFLPAKLTGLVGALGQTPFYHFPIIKFSPLYSKLYRWQHIAFDCGITTHIFDELKIRNQRNVFESLYSEFYEIYLKSDYFKRFGQYIGDARRESNIITLCTVVLLLGFTLALAFLFYEIYLKNCFGNYV